MIDIFKDPVITPIEDSEVQFTVNCRNDDIHFIGTSNCIVSLYSPILANKLSSSTVKSAVLTDDKAVLMTVGEARNIPAGKHVFWGCNIPEKTENVHEIRALAGFGSYANLGLPAGLMFDSRILFPWCLGAKRLDPQIKVCLIPGYDDIHLLKLSSELEKSGIRTIDPKAHIRTQTDMIARSKLLVTSSISAYILGDVLGVPTYLFHTGKNSERLIEELSDYYGAFDAVCPEVLDFSSSISISSFPHSPTIPLDVLKDRIRQFLSVSPFELRENVEQDILEYFDALS